MINADRHLHDSANKDEDQRKAHKDLRDPLAVNEDNRIAEVEDNPEILGAVLIVQILEMGLEVTTEK